MVDNVSITPGSGTTIAADEVTDGTLGTVKVQIVKLMGGALDDSTKILAEPFGALQTNTGFQTLFYDEWATSPIDTTDRWTVTGTTPTVSGGVMTMVATLATYNAIVTKDNIKPNVGFTLVRNGIALETTAATGCGRFWGLGTTASTPAAAVLAQNGIGFEIDQATGSLLAVTYAAGVRTTVATLTRPSDGAYHAYGLYFRVTQAYWIVDGVTVASQSFPNVQIAGLPAIIVRQNAASFTGTPVFNNIAHLTADTSRQGVLVSDPLVGTRQARVKAASTAAIASDNALVVAVSPNNSVAVTGTFWQATQPVSLAVNTPVIATGSNVIGSLVANQSVNNAQVGGVAVATGNGVTGTGSQRVTVASDNTAFNVNPSATAAAGGITSTARLPSAAASTNATNVKTTAGRVYAVTGKNNATYDVFLVLYDAATNPPVPGTTTIRKKMVCPAGSAFVYDWPVGLSFATGIGYAFTKLVADADTTALVAADVTAFNLDYV